MGKLLPNKLMYRWDFYPYTIGCITQLAQVETILGNRLLPKKDSDSITWHNPRRNKISSGSQDLKVVYLVRNVKKILLQHKRIPMSIVSSHEIDRLVTTRSSIYLPIHQYNISPNNSPFPALDKHRSISFSVVASHRFNQYVYFL